VKKVCVCVPDVKKETTFEFSAVCEDFCVPGRSRVVGHCHTKDCRGCDVCRPIRQPTCAEVRTRIKLVKTPVTCETPTVKWIVKTVCAQCGACSGSPGDSCVEPSGQPCTTAVSATGAMPRPAGVAAPLIVSVEQPLAPATLPLRQAGIPPLPPEVPSAVPASYSASSTLSELFAPESR